VKPKDFQLKHPLKFLIQERFRKPSYSRFRDITITEWNLLTEKPSELYKIASGLFVYGVVKVNKNDVPCGFSSVYIMDVVKLLLWISGYIGVELEVNPRSKQRFCILKVEELRQANILLYEDHDVE